MAYRYADSRAKYIDLQIKSDYAYNRRVLSHDNTHNLHEIKVINSLVSLNKEGVVRVQHPTISLVKMSELHRNNLKEAAEGAVNICEGGTLSCREKFINKRQSYEYKKDIT